jgi:myxalamid-type polyketide synthase MxaE and MxaD
MATDELKRLFAGVGLQAMPAAAALAVLETLLASKATQKTVAAVDWSIFKPVYEARCRRPLLDEVGAAEPPGIAPPPTAPLLRALEGAGAERARPILLAAVRAEVARVLGLDAADAVPASQGFFRMGMNSLMTVELRSRLEALLGRRLPPTVAFEYPTVESLTTYLVGEVLGIPSPVRGPVEAGAPAPDSTPDASLSEDELAALLVAKLKEIR